MSHPLARVKDADHAVRLVLHVLEGGGQLKAIDLFETREVCNRCGRGPRATKGDPPNTRDICAACGLAWDGHTEGWLRRGTSLRGRSFAVPTDRGQGLRPAHLPVKETRSMRRRAIEPVEMAAELLGRLVPLVLTRPRASTELGWRFDLQALALHIEGHGRSYAQVAEIGSRKLPRLASPPTRTWEGTSVQRAVARARETIERRLRRARRRRRGEGWSGPSGSEKPAVA